MPQVSEDAELLLHVKDWNRLGSHGTLGEVSFPLKQCELPPSGAPITLVKPLQDVSEGSGARKLKRGRKPQVHMPHATCHTPHATRRMPHAHV